MLDTDKLVKLPRHSELYHWADYIELRCLTDLDGTFSVARIVEQRNLASDLSEESLDAQDIEEGDVADLLSSVGMVTSSELDNLFPDPSLNGAPDDEDLEEAGVEDDQNYGRAAEIADDTYRWAQEIMRYLAARQESLGEVYPFLVDDAATLVTRLDRSDLRDRYIFLLLCSSLSYTNKSNAQVLTTAFEICSFEVLRQMLPEHAEIDHYGTAGGFSRSRFTGTPYERLTALAAELRGKVAVDPTDFHPRDSGDSGLDIVAWIPMQDPAEGVMSIFAQCACGKKWEGKQFEASPERVRRYITLVSPSTSVTLIPYYFRRLGDTWYVGKNVAGLLVDRLRILRAIPKETPLDLPQALVKSAWEDRLPTI